MQAFQLQTMLVAVQHRLQDSQPHWLLCHLQAVVHAAAILAAQLAWRLWQEELRASGLPFTLKVQQLIATAIGMSSRV